MKQHARDALQPRRHSSYVLFCGAPVFTINSSIMMLHSSTVVLIVHDTGRTIVQLRHTFGRVRGLLGMTIVRWYPYRFRTLAVLLLLSCIVACTRARA